MATWLLFCATVLAAPVATSAKPAHRTSHLVKIPRVPAPLVAARTVVPDLVEEIRYATADNFTGAPVPGYEAPACWLLPRTARALAKAQAALAPFGLSLKVMDCYRPRRAVTHFLQWSSRADDGSTRRDYLPRVARQNAFRLGYLSSKSAHSRGTTVDVTLVAAGSAAAAPKAQTRACHLAQAADLGPGELNLGTRYDCFDPTAHTFNPNVAPEARALRMLLARVMRDAGFVGYVREWWHFTLAGSARAPTYDFPIRASAAGEGAGQREE